MKCETCKGTGEEVQIEETDRGLKEGIVKCCDCDGTGEFIE